jgi:hypothetical protein
VDYLTSVLLGLVTIIAGHCTNCIRSYFASETTTITQNYSQVVNPNGFYNPWSLPEDLYPLAWLIGTWKGKGQGEFAGVAPFQFIQEVTFNHDGRNS